MPFDIVINFENGKEERRYETLLKLSNNKRQSINEKMIESKDSNGLHNIYDIKMYKAVAEDDPRIINEEETSTQYHKVLISTIPTQRKNDSKIVIQPPKPKKRIIEDIDELLDDVTSKINENHETIKYLSEYCQREIAPTSHTSKMNKELHECIRNSNQHVQLAKKFGDRFNVSLIASPRDSVNCIAYLKSQANATTENKEREVFKSIHSDELEIDVTPGQHVTQPVLTLLEILESKMINTAIATPSIPLEPRRSSISSIRRKPSIPSTGDDTNIILDADATSSSKVYSSSPLNIHTMNMRVGKGTFVRDDDESNMPLRDREFLDAALELKKKQNIRGYPVDAKAFMNENNIIFRERVDDQVKNLTHIKGTKQILKRNKKSLNLAIEQCRVKGRHSIDITTNIISLWRGYIQYLLHERSKMISELKRREFHLPYTLEKRFQQYLNEIECEPVDAVKDDSSTFITQSPDRKMKQTSSKKSHNSRHEGRVSKGITNEISSHQHQWYTDLVHKVKKRITLKNLVDECQKLPESVIDLLFIVKEMLQACAMHGIEFTSKDFFDIIRLGVRQEVDYRDDLIAEIIINVGKAVGVSLEEIYEYYKSNKFGFPPFLLTTVRKHRRAGSFDSDASILSLSEYTINTDISITG
jgi:hypothetical protein